MYITPFIVLLLSLTRCAKASKEIVGSKHGYGKGSTGSLTTSFRTMTGGKRVTRVEKKAGYDILPRIITANGKSFLYNPLGKRYNAQVENSRMILFNPMGKKEGSKRQDSAQLLKQSMSQNLSNDGGQQQLYNPVGKKVKEIENDEDRLKQMNAGGTNRDRKEHPEGENGYFIGHHKDMGKRLHKIAGLSGDDDKKIRQGFLNLMNSMVVNYKHMGKRAQDDDKSRIRQSVLNLMNPMGKRQIIADKVGDDKKIGVGNPAEDSIALEDAEKEKMYDHNTGSESGCSGLNRLNEKCLAKKPSSAYNPNRATQNQYLPMFKKKSGFGMLSSDFTSPTSNKRYWRDERGKRISQPEYMSTYFPQNVVGTNLIRNEDKRTFESTPILDEVNLEDQLKSVNEAEEGNVGVPNKQQYLHFSSMGKRAGGRLFKDFQRFGKTKDKKNLGTLYRTGRNGDEPVEFPFYSSSLENTPDFDKKHEWPQQNYWRDGAEVTNLAAQESPKVTTYSDWPVDLQNSSHPAAKRSFARFARNSSWQTASGVWG